MPRTLASVSLLATLAACGEPLLYEGEELDASAAAALTTATLKLVEVCNDGIDNDKDGYTDRYDPDCRYATSAGTATIGYSGTTLDGSDIHPGWLEYMTLDGAKISLEARDGGLVVKDRYGTRALVYTDSDVVWVGIGQRYDSRGTRLPYQDLIVLTAGHGAAYAPGQVGGVYDLADPYTTSSGGSSGGSTGPISGGGTTCTLSCY